MAKIYLPSNLFNKDCKVVYNDYIRVFDSSSYTSWTDVYFKSDYMLKKGSSNYGQTNVVCDNLNTYTDNVYYRYDMPNILIMFFIIIIICFWFPYRIFSRAFGRWLRI